MFVFLLESSTGQVDVWGDTRAHNERYLAAIRPSRLRLRDRITARTDMSPDRR